MGISKLWKNPETGKPRQVHINVFYLIVVGALALIVLGTGTVWVASDTNASCIACHNEHGAQWEVSTHKTVDCVECHIEPGMVGHGQAKIKGVQNLWVSLTKGNKVAKSEDPLPISTENCISCHHGILMLNEIGYEDLPDNSLVYNGLKMGHRIHVEKHEIDCVWCHRGTVHRDPGIVGKYEFNMPFHEDCMQCHNGEPLEEYGITLPHVQDGGQCQMCHTTYQPDPEVEVEDYAAE
jgi:nitrate/TMAO reductase-like tetraheme cytochrome c subunit